MVFEILMMPTKDKEHQINWKKVDQA